MRVRLMKMLLVTVLCLAGPLEAASRLPAGVQSFAPTGRVADNAPFRLVFKNPMVPKGQTGKSLAAPDFPFSVTPPVQAEGKWLNERTFTARLLAPLKMATAYTATLKEGLADRQGRKVGPGTFQFNTGALEVASGTSAPTGLSAVLDQDGRARLTLNFNMPVSPVRLRGFLRVTNEGGKELEYTLAGSLPSRSIQVLVPLRNPTARQALTVRVASGFTAQDGDLGLAKDYSSTVTLQPVLMATDIRGWGRSIRLEFNGAVDPGAARDFITIAPPTEFSVDSGWSDNQLTLQGDFAPRSRFTVTLRKGLPGKGLALKEDFKQAVIMPDLEPQVSLPAVGSYLTPGGTVPVELTNVKKLQVDLWRLYENNIPYVIRGDWHSFQKDLARRVYSREFDLSLPLNEPVRRGLDVGEMAGGERGLFLLSLQDLERDYWSEESQIINLSDLGAVARVWEDGLLVWTNTLSAAEPVEGATVRVLSGANQLLAEGRTDAEGVFLCERSWTPEEQPGLAIVSKGKDLTYVQLTRSLLSQEAFDTAGRPWLKEYDGMIFSPRDIYRTGEEASFKAIVRNGDVSTPAPFPVLFVARDPLGRKARQEMTTLSEAGSASFSLPLPSNALTGVWTAALAVPGREDKPLASMAFHVEDFAPPRVEVKLDTGVGALTHGDEFFTGIHARWLFGAEGAGLRYRVSWLARASDFKPERWRGYSFGDPDRKFAPQEGEIGEGTLDGGGKATASLTLDAPWEAASTIDVTLRAEVMEEGGRWVSSSVTRPYFPAPWLLGIAQSGPFSFKVAAIDAGENPADPGTLTAVLYRVTWNYNIVEVDGYRRWQSSEELTQAAVESLTLKDGVGSVAFRPLEPGSYLVRVFDSGNKASASCRFFAGDPAQAGGSQLLDRVEVATDKEFYKAGETAKVTLKVPFEGLLLVNVEGQGLLSRQVLRAKEAEAAIEVPFTQAMVPNAWITAWLIRPVSKDEAWGAHRAIGVARIKADLSDHRLDVGMEAAAQAEPASKLPVALTLKDAEGRPAKGADVALALVDEAVLNLTRYRTPDPLNHFWGLKELGSAGYDLYDQLIPLEYTEALHPAGGEAMAALAGGTDIQRFKILSLFQGTLEADADGVARTELDLPEFSGQGRLFVVVASGNRFGLAEQPVQIARSVVTEASLPRFAAPGDSFIVPITVFNTSGEAREVTVGLDVQGGLSPEETGKTLSIAPGGSGLWNVRARALEGFDSATWAIVTSWAEGGERKEFRQETDLPIRSPWPVVARSGSGTFEAGETAIDVPAGDFVRPAGTLTLADTPVVDLNRAVEFLKNYPYGCLEQTLSTAWPFLVLPDAVAAMDPLLVSDAAVANRTGNALARLQAMQLYDGSFETWPGSGKPYSWGSVYAAHFLIEARDAGLSYPEEMLTGAINWLRQFMASMPAGGERDDLTTKAYGAYVLARFGERPLGWVEYLKENQSRLWPSGRIWLAGTQALLDGRADALRALNLGEPIPAEARGQVLESEARNTAQLLSLWLEVEPQAPEALELAARLMKQDWHGTQDNALALMALARWNLIAGGGKAALKGVLAGTSEVPYESGKTTAVALPEGGTSFRLNVAGSGTGYYSWSLTGTPKARPKAERSGLDVECLWVDERGNTVKGPIPQGKRFQVILTLKPAMAVSNLAVSCLLPAGLELENPRLDEGVEIPNDVVVDARDDRLLLFFDRLAGERTYGFKVRAVTKGTFAAPPLSAMGMYDPAVRFTGEAWPDLVIE